MRWLEAHYRHALDMFGFEYPTSYMLIADLGVFTLCVAAVAQRVLAGPSGLDWVWISSAVVAALVPHGACLYVGWKPRILGVTAFTIAAVVLFWQVPVKVDVATLLLPLAATIIAAAATRRNAVISTAALAATAFGGSVAGVIAQGWLVVLMVGFGGVVGYLLQKQLLLLRSERLAQTQQMALDRAAIAGEVHDVLAHSLSIMMLNVTAARRALREHQDLPEAAEALEDAEQVGRSAMQDVRRTIELLRSTDATAPTTPQPGLADLPELIDGFRRAGVDVDEAVEPGRVSAGTGLAVYRVVQESLSNASRHAAGSSVSVSVYPESADVLAVRISNGVTVGTGRGGGGSGLAGMASRVEHCGGTFRAQIVDGQWRVEAFFPIGARARHTTDTASAVEPEAVGFHSGTDGLGPRVSVSDGPSVAGSV
ncbi:sensor histidine kinase [Gordonia sp. DT30]|uniref:sensor histidine kinase n=1 Tax=unclassified Gordonia (in: high G+C Gram-positive bacteria) TaxID=2657482 RepID=UPI003CF6B5F6